MNVRGDPMKLRTPSAKVKIWQFVAGAAFVAHSGLAHAQGEPLSGDAISEAVAGAAVHIDAPMGGVLPVVFSQGGSLTGTAGPLRYFLGSESDRGRWWVTNDRLCLKWSKWFDAETSCMRVRRQGAKVTWLRDDGKTGSATIVAQDKTRNDMSVAMVAGQPSLRLGGPPPLPADTADRAPHPTSQARPSMPKATPSAAPVAPQQKAPAPSHTATTTTAPATASGRVMVRQRAVPPAISVAPPAQATATAGRAPAPAVTLPAPSYRVVHVRTDDVLNIRSAPSAEAEIIGAIPYYSGGVRRIGPCHGEWCAIAFNTTTGWVNQQYLSPEPSPGSGRGAYHGEASRRRAKSNP